MATTIGKLNVVLSGSVNGFLTSFGKARKAMSGFSSQAASVAAGIGVFRVLDAGANALKNFSTKGFETIDSIAKLSDRLGIATEKLAGLQYAADLSGVSNEELTGGLEKMLRVLGEAGNGSNTAIDAFARIGLSMDQLAGKSPDQVFGMIGDKLSEITDPSERAAAAMGIFGKSAQGLLPLLFEGSEGMAALQKRAEELGLSFTRVDAAQVEAANDAITTAGKVLDGIGQKIAVELAPFIKVATDELTKMALAGDGLDKVSVAVEQVVKGLGTLADYLEIVNAAWQSLRAIGAGALWAVQAPLMLILKAGIAVADLIGADVPVSVRAAADAMQEFGATAVDAAGRAAKAFDTFQSGGHSRAASKAYDDIRRAARSAAEEAESSGKRMSAAMAQASEDTVRRLNRVKESIEDLQREVDRFNWTDATRRMAEFADAGATNEQLWRIAELLARLEDLKLARERQEKAERDAAEAAEDAAREARRRDEELDDEARRVMEDNLLPFERYQKELDKLSDLLLMGRIDWETYQRAVTKAKDELDRPADLGNLEAPKLLEAGSAAAADFFAQMEAGQTGEKQKNEQKLLRENETQTDIQRTIAQRLVGLAIPTVVKF